MYLKRLIIIVSLLLLSLVLFSNLTVYFSKKERGTQLSQIIDSELERQKEMLLLQSDVIELPLLHTLNPLVKDVIGSVIWSCQKQQGVLLVSGLPILSKDQYYQFLVYDLESSVHKPVSITYNNHHMKKDSKEMQLLPFDSEKIVKNPYKFELVLKESGVSYTRQLFLAQP